VDETGHTFRARLGTTWALVGHRPVLRRLSKRREVSSIVLLTAPLDGAPARLYARHFRGTISWREVLRALPYFRRRVGRPLLLVWDHLNAHTARVVQAFLAARPADFAAAWLPGYAPELNPEEQCNRWVKRDLENALPASIDEVHANARRSFRRLQRHPKLLRAFFAHAGLSLK
jgi:transposase